MKKKCDLAKSWHRASLLVFTGMVLGALTLNFRGLEYILPAVSAVLLLLGFRSLRQENSWFMGCYILAVFRLAYIFAYLLIHTTILPGLLRDFSIFSASLPVSLSLSFATYFCFWMALRTMKTEAGEEPRTAAAFAVIVWYAVLCLLALLDLQGLLFIGIALVSFILVFYNLLLLLLEMDADGYEISPVPERFSDRSLLSILTAVLLIGGICGFLLGSKYPMSYSKAENGESGKEIRAHLTELGFPEYVLDDLSASDLSSCSGAVQVIFSESSEPVTYKNTEFSKNELRLTNVGVQLAEETERWVIFHHFLWTSNPGFCGTECLEVISPGPIEGWSRDGNPTGRVLYDRDKITYESSFHTLGTQSSADLSGLGADHIFVGFSMPYRGENQRGYISYTILSSQSNPFFNSWINYTHQKSRLQYPAQTAMDTGLENPRYNNRAFQTVQSSFHFESGE